MNRLSKFIYKLFTKNNADTTNITNELDKNKKPPNDNGVWVYFDNSKELFDSCYDEANVDCDNCVNYQTIMLEEIKSLSFEIIDIKGIIRCPVCGRKYFIGYGRNKDKE